jgi:hypothetical protein
LLPTKPASSSDNLHSNSAWAYYYVLARQCIDERAVLMTNVPPASYHKKTTPTYSDAQTLAKQMMARCSHVNPPEIGDKSNQNRPC